MEIADVAEAISTSKLVGLGESTHGTHEFFDFKSRLFRQLVTGHGFNTLLFEDSQEACCLVNDYISGKDVDLASACGKLYSIWRTEELKQLVVWLKDYRPSAKIEFVGFDINQAEYSDLSSRDELMAENIRTYCAANPNTRAVVWAHNSHIQLDGGDIQPRPMGYFLRNMFGQQYRAIALLFGKGSLSAIRLKDDDAPGRDRSLGIIKVNSLPDTLAEAAFDALTDTPVFISQDQIRQIDPPDRVRSIGWGLVPELVNEMVERVDLKQEFDHIAYFPRGTHSHPLS